MDYWRGLTVKMLGTLELDFDGHALHLPMKQSAKPVQLLLLLLTVGDAGVSRRRVMEFLFENESEADAANSLNVTVSRLRRILKDSGLPEGKYIQVNVDRYYFKCPFPLWVDATEADRLRQAADILHGSNRTTVLYQICDLYYGRFLPDLDGEDWVEVYRAHFQRIFRVSMEELIVGLEATRSYGEVLRLASFGAQLFPFDEWQVWQQKALLAMGRIEDAHELYHQVEKLYANELGVVPPAQMLTQLQYGVDPLGSAEDIEAVRSRLVGDTSDDNIANYLPLPSFLAAARIVMSAQNSVAAMHFSCVLCTLTSSTRLPAVEMFEAMDELEERIVPLLGPRDIYARYSKSQFIVMLTDQDAQCSRAMDFVFELKSSFEPAAREYSVTLTGELLL